MGDESKKIATTHQIIEKAPINDPLTVYYLHHSDSTGAILVSQAFTGDNYASWSRSILIALSVKNKVGFLDGSIPKPESGDEKLVNSWIRNNNVVVSWLLNSVSKEIARSILYGDVVEEIRTDLKERFRQSNGPRIFELRRDLANIRQGQDSISRFFTKLKSIWEELNEFKPQCKSKSCTELYNMEYGMVFLMGLNDTYSTLRGQLLLIEPIPLINKIFALCLQEEKQRYVGLEEITTDPVRDMAMMTREDSTLRKPFKGKERTFCTHCKMAGHTVEKCYKIHGYPPGMQTRQQGSQSKFRGQSNSIDARNIKLEEENGMLDNLTETTC